METQNTEYKRLWKDEYLHYISGFANAGGGTLFIGKDDNGNIVGIDNAEYLLENLPNKAVQATGIVPEINLLNENGKEYLAIHIKPSEQPVSCNGKYYLRSGSTLQELNGANGTALSPDDVGSLSVDVGSLSVIQPTERQQKIIDLIKINPQISAQQMSVVLSVVPRTIYRELSYMQKRGFIIHESNTSAGRWVVLRQG